jgi:hypothetical protein
MKQGYLGMPVASVVMACLISCGMILVATGVQGHFGRRFAACVTALAGAALPVVMGHCLVLWCFYKAGQPTDSALAVLTALIVPFGIGVGLRWAPRPVRRILL